jgi:LacI family transcriptional regulator
MEFSFMKITIKDIASQAGVSIGTVSKIITDKYKLDNVKISKKTIDRVHRVIKKLNYEPDYAARLLSTGRTFTIGICIPKSRHKGFHLEHYYSNIIDKIEKEAVKTNYDILLVNFDKYVNKFNSRRIDGLIIIEQWEEDDQLKLLLKENRKFVVINNFLKQPEGMHSINMDNAKGVRDVVACFKQNNHKNLAYIGELINNSKSMEQTLRKDWFVSYMKDAGMPVNPELLLLGEMPGITEQLQIEHSYDQMSGYLGIEYLLKNFKGQFTGVFCANDLVALGAMDYLYEHNIRVPEEMSLIGFDNLDFAAYLMGGLTTVWQPLDKLGETAFNLLLRMINEPDDKSVSGQVTTIIEPELIVRNSVAKL